MASKVENVINDDEQDLDKAWDDIVMIENRVFSKGFEEGKKFRREQLNKEAEELGASKGSELGKEIGHYIGFAQFFIEHLEEKQELTSKSKKTLENLHKLEKLANEFPDSPNVDVDLDQLRGQLNRLFKLCKSLLGLKIDSTDSNNQSW